MFKWTYLSHFVIISAGAAPVPRFATRPKGLSTLELEELRKMFVVEETFQKLGENMEQKLRKSSDKLMLLKGHRLGNRIRLNLVHDGSRMTSASVL